MAGIKLVVCEVPARKGKWLCTQEGSLFRHLAKFRDEESVEQFFRWVDDCDGKTLRRGVDE